MSTELEKVNTGKDIMAGQYVAYIPSMEDWSFMVQWGEQAMKSGMLPPAIKTREAAAIIILKGRELGLSFMTSISSIHVISGKPSMSAELMQLMARKNLPGLKINVVEVSAEKAVVKFKRPEPESEWFTSTFTMEDAKKAELLGNSSWKKYPKAMLWSRAVTAGLRIICPESLQGVIYCPEELGASVNEAGDVIETTSRPATESEKPPLGASVNEAGPATESEKPPQKTEKIKLQKQMVECVSEKKIDPKVIKEYLQGEFSVESSKYLNEEQLKTFVDWLSIYTVPVPVPVKEEIVVAEWEVEVSGMDSIFVK